MCCKITSVNLKKNKLPKKNSGDNESFINVSDKHQNECSLITVITLI